MNKYSYIRFKLQNDSRWQSGYMIENLCDQLFDKKRDVRISVYIGPFDESTMKGLVKDLQRRGCQVRVWTEKDSVFPKSIKEKIKGVVRAENGTPFLMEVQETIRDTSKMKAYLTSEPCDCGDKFEFLCYPEDGCCTCGTKKHHVHCKTCGGISQWG